jgi:hypothetical protein
MRRPFCWAGSRPASCCIAHVKMLLCKQRRCPWYIVYITSSGDDGTASASPQPEREDVQDCRNRPVARERLVWPPPGRYRSPAFDQCRHRRPQRRRSIHRPLIAAGTSFPNPATFVSPREAKLNIFENGFEFFRSHFFSCDCARRSCFSVKSRLRQFHPLRRYSLEAWYTE